MDTGGSEGDKRRLRSKERMFHDCQNKQRKSSFLGARRDKINGGDDGRWSKKQSLK